MKSEPLITQKQWNAKLRELRVAKERISTLEALSARDSVDAAKWRNYVQAHQLTEAGLYGILGVPGKAGGAT